MHCPVFLKESAGTPWHQFRIEFNVKMPGLFWGNNRFQVDPGPWLNGSVSIYDDRNQLVSTIEVARWLGVGVLGHTHPHDAIFLDNGDIAVAVWKGHEPGSLGGLEYWAHIPEGI